MTGPARRPRGAVPARGFTLFELAVATIVVVLLCGLLLVRLQTYQQQAERTSVEQLVGTLRTALSVRSAQLSVARMEHELPQIIDPNPIRLLQNPPQNYLGEYYSPRVNTLPKGTWHFDRSDKTLVYLIAQGKSFSGAEVNLLKFKVEFPDSTLHTSKASGAPRLVRGAVLQEVAGDSAINQQENGH